MDITEVDFKTGVSGEEFTYNTISSEDCDWFLVSEPNQTVSFVDNEYPDVRIRVPFSNVSAIREYVLG